MDLRNDVIAAFRNAEINAKVSNSPSWHILPDKPSVGFGFDPDEDYFFLAMAPSSGPETEWEATTMVFQQKRGGIHGLPPLLNSSLCIRFNTRMFKDSKIIDFVVDLVKEIGTDTDVEDLFTAVLAEYEAIFALIAQPLSSAQVRGLIGELLVLNHLLKSQGQSVAESWLGPTGSLHDFENPGWHIEVKESMRPDPIASIHPIEQLEPIELPFNLVVMQLRHDEEGISLPELIGEIRSKLGEGNNFRTHFEDVLLSSGYRDEDSTGYVDSRYSPGLQIRLRIDESANVLYPAMISNNVHYSDIRWWLRSSEHDFVSIEDEFWADPTV